MNTSGTLAFKWTQARRLRQGGKRINGKRFPIQYLFYLKPNAILRAMDASRIYKITCWSNGIALIIFLGIEIFWFVEESKKFKDALPLAVAFVLYNLPFFLLGLSLYFQPIPTGWIGVLRLVFLLVCIPINLWLHYHGDNGGNSVGMILVVFLLGAVPFVVIMEVFIWFYNYGK